MNPNVNELDANDLVAILKLINRANIVGGEAEQVSEVKHKLAFLHNRLQAASSPEVVKMPIEVPAADGAPKDKAAN